MGKPKPVSVSATIHKKIGDYKTKGVGRWVAFDTDDLKFETEDSAAGIIRFANGASMNFEVSWAINDKGTDIYSYIYGDKAGASLNPLGIYGEEQNYLLDSNPVIRPEDNFFNEISHFIECVKEGKEPISPAEDGVNIQKILNGIYDSAKAGKEILV
jgi:predicted dehydrogenase